MGTLELTRFPLLCWAVLSLACQPNPKASASGLAASVELPALHTPPQAAPHDEPQPSSSELPIDADDGVWGAAAAPVTVVVFTDLQCPFCARGHASLIELEKRYGESQLRVVIKHVPLAGHEGAVPAARVAQAVLALAGRARFFQYLDHAFANQERVATGGALALATELGLDRGVLAERAESAAIGAQVLADVMLADRIAVPATPHYRINGLPLTGVRSTADFTRLIERELAKAAALRKAGIAASDVYARRVQQNFSLSEADAASRTSP